MVLLDSTDDIPDIGKHEIRTVLIDHGGDGAGLRPAGARVCSIQDARRPQIFAKCNPGDGADLSEYTANPRLAKKRWMEGFRAPLDESLDGGFRPLPGKTSPIMETVQRIAVDRFTGRAAEGPQAARADVRHARERSRLFAIHRRPNYGRFKASRAYKKLQTDLHGAEVTIYYIQRATAKPFNSADHIRFWADWIRDNKGRFKQANKLQGEG